MSERSEHRASASADQNYRRAEEIFGELGSCLVFERLTRMKDVDLE